MSFDRIAVLLDNRPEVHANLELPNSLTAIADSQVVTVITPWSRYLSSCQQYVDLMLTTRGNSSTATPRLLVTAAGEGDVVETACRWTDQDADIINMLKSNVVSQPKARRLSDAIRQTLASMSQTYATNVQDRSSLLGPRFKALILVYDNLEGLPTDEQNPFSYIDGDGQALDLRLPLHEAVTTATCPPTSFRALDVEIVRVLQHRAERSGTTRSRIDVLPHTFAPGVRLSLHHVPLARLGDAMTNLAVAHGQMQVLKFDGCNKLGRGRLFFMGGRAFAIPKWVGDGSQAQAQGYVEVFREEFIKKRVTKVRELKTLKGLEGYRETSKHTAEILEETCTDEDFAQGETAYFAREDDISEKIAYCLQADGLVCVLRCMEEVPPLPIPTKDLTKMDIKSEHATVLEGKYKAVNDFVEPILTWDGSDDAKKNEALKKLRILSVFVESDQPDLFIEAPPSSPEALRALYAALLTDLLTFTNMRPSSVLHKAATLAFPGHQPRLTPRPPRLLRRYAHPHAHDVPAAPRQPLPKPSLPAGSGPKTIPNPFTMSSKFGNADPSPEVLAERKLTSYLAVQPMGLAQVREEARLRRAAVGPEGSLWAWHVGVTWRSKGRRRAKLLDRPDFDGRVDGMNWGEGAVVGDMMTREYNYKGKSRNLVPMDFD
ncbi:hypothetical protein HK101_011395 [Irineochytrium annulatum]|nr:hypothetical protein HK101_011395 [Irineochytrium annulatum]